MIRTITKAVSNIKRYACFSFVGKVLSGTNDTTNPSRDNKNPTMPTKYFINLDFVKL